MSNWVRASKQRKCLCGHSDWCLVSKDGTSALCMRLSSDRPFTFKDGSQGWIHKLTDPAPPAYTKDATRKRPAPHWGRLFEELWSDTPMEWLKAQAQRLGVMVSALQTLRVCRYCGRDTAFPMRNGRGDIIGFRIRTPSGNKFAIEGSENGLFLPWAQVQKTMWLAEGASDTAAGLSMGLYTVGRPSCSGGVQHVLDLIRLNNVARVILIPDCDDDTEREKGFNPGLRGAEGLVKFLRVPSATMVLPCKDLRDFYRDGGTRALLESQAKQLVWSRPTCST